MRPKIISAVVACAVVMSLAATLMFARPRMPAPEILKPAQSSQQPTVTANATFTAQEGAQGNAIVARDEPGASSRISPDVLSYKHPLEHSVRFEEGKAIVHAKAFIFDRRRDSQYVWRLRVSDAKGNHLVGQLYRDQMISMAESDTATPEFFDVVPVPAGAKRVELMLYEKRPQVTLTRLMDDSQNKPYQALRLVKPVP